MISSKKWIGIDGGGTKTSCIIGDEKGNLLSMSISSSSNIQAVHHQQVRTTLNKLITQIIMDSNSTFEQIDAISLCLAGADRDADKEIIRTFFEDTTFENNLTI